MSFHVGAGEVICGWDGGLVGQCVGSRVLLFIPAESGYGDHGAPQAGIKGGAALIFATETLGIA